MISLAICGSPRTGGNWLCDLLRDAGVGYGDEYLSKRVREPLLAEWRVAESRYWPTLWQRRTVNGVFCVKIHWGELRYPFMAGDPRRALPPDRPTVWVLQTRDPRSQAISWARAFNTKRWFGKEAETPVPEQEIARFLPFCLSEPKLWNRWFTAHRIAPLRIPFEELAADPAAATKKVVRKVLRCLND